MVNFMHMTVYRNTLLKCSTVTGSMYVRIVPRPPFQVSSGCSSAWIRAPRSGFNNLPMGRGCRRFKSSHLDHFCKHSIMVLSQPSKLRTRVRFSLLAPFQFQSCGSSSEAERDFSKVDVEISIFSYRSKG